MYIINIHKKREREYIYMKCPHMMIQWYINRNLSGHIIGIIWDNSS